MRFHCPCLQELLLSSRSAPAERSVQEVQPRPSQLQSVCVLTSRSLPLCPPPEAAVCSDPPGPPSLLCGRWLVYDLLHTDARLSTFTLITHHTLPITHHIAVMTTPVECSALWGHLCLHTMIPPYNYYNILILQDTILHTDQYKACRTHDEFLAVHDLQTQCFFLALLP